MTKSTKNSSWWGTIITAIIMILIVILLRVFVFSPVIISGHSMDPTLHNGERVIALKHTKIERFDIVTLKAPDNPDEDYVKRIIGLPGDTIEMKNDQLYINGKKYDEPFLDDYIKKMKNHTLANVYPEQFKYVANTAQNFTNNFTLQDLEATGGKVKVPKDSYFVMGDNRLVSKDSRYLGFIPKSSILGEVKFAFWPLKYFGPIH